MENLNAEQVKEWLLVCAEDTPYPDQSKALHDALALINSQEQRIKELTEENEKLTINMNAYGLTAKRLGEENERLKLADNIASVSVPEALRIINEYCESYIKRAEAKTVRKMQERLENRFDEDGNYFGNEVHSKIDQIAKEMLEGENEG